MAAPEAAAMEHVYMVEFWPFVNHH